MSESKRYNGAELERQTQAVEEFVCDFLQFRYHTNALVTRDVSTYFTRTGLKLPDLLIDFGHDTRKVLLEITTEAESFNGPIPTPKREERKLYKNMSVKTPVMGGLIVYQQHVAKSSGVELMHDTIFAFAHGLDHDRSQGILDTFARQNMRNVWPADQVNWVEHMEKMRRHFGMR